MTTRWIALVTAALLAFLLGARAVGGSDPVAPETSVGAAGVREHDAWRGSFWRPAGSAAAPPAPRLERVAWTPARGTPGAQPSALAAVGAIVRLAALD
jgi:hypothetical protein